jgi:hypothetical protein
MEVGKYGRADVADGVPQTAEPGTQRLLGRDVESSETVVEDFGETLRKIVRVGH